MSDPQLKIRKWLQQELKELGHGAKGQLADYLGVRLDAITRMANTDPAKETRVIQAHEHMKMQEFFASRRGTRQKAIGLRAVTVAAFVQAGHWAEAWEWDERDNYEVFVPDDSELRPFRLYAAETRGPSMNRRWPERTVVIFTNVQETMEEPIPGKRYIVERRRLGGDSEHTVKLLHVDADGKPWLLPESDDPRFQAPISIEDGVGNEEDLVIILGRVRFAVSRE